jgi:predicted dehydrogenase
MDPLRVGVIGVGIWGEKHARLFSALPDCRLVGVHDRRPEAGEAVAARYGTRHFPSAAALLAEVEAVSVAVPTVCHREVTEEALAAGRHVLVEKPMADSVEAADAMLRAAQRAGRQLQVGQVERFNPIWLAGRARVVEPKFIEAHRLAPFQPRSLDIDVVGDLMIHDLDLVLQAVGQPPTSISAGGIAVLSTNEDIANARLEFEDGCVANLTASRVSQERVRKVRFFQRTGYLSLDLFAKTGEHVAVDVARFRPEQPLAALRRETLSPAAGEPLALQLGAFALSLRTGATGAASGWEGREALRVAEEVRAALRERARQWVG